MNENQPQRRESGHARWRHHAVNRHRRGGYTLLELIVSASIGSLLLIGLSSALVISARSLESDAGTWSKTRAAHRVLCQMERDIQSARSLVELTATSVTLTVPDRNGDNVAETIRYAWSGVAGEPLERSYNGATLVMAEDVQSFSLDWVTRSLEGVLDQPRILFVTGQSPTVTMTTQPLSANESILKEWFQNWGYEIDILSDAASQAEFDAALTSASVVYLSQDIDPVNLGSKVTQSPVGVVSESLESCTELGIYTGTDTQLVATDQISIATTDHFITHSFSTGSLTILSSSHNVAWNGTGVAVDGTTVATVTSAASQGLLITLDQGDTAATGAPSAGRRCKLPWGDGNLDPHALTSDGRTLLRRAIEWAAGAGSEMDADSVLFGSTPQPAPAES